MNKKLTELKTKVTELIKKAEAEQNPLREALAQDAAAIAKATEAMEAATAKSDINAYKKAKADKEDAETLQAMHKARLDAVTVKPLMTKEEYLKDVEIVKAITENERKTRSKQLCELAEQMSAIAEDASAIQATANETLLLLQREVYKCADMTDSEKRLGKFKNVDNLSNVYCWGKCAVNYYQYEEYKRTEAK